MGSPLDRFLHPHDQYRIIEAIKAGERLCSGELKVHVEGRTPGGDVRKRAQELFTSLGLSKTAERNAVLIYAATRDRRFIILGDVGIAEEPDSPFWADARQRLTVAFTRGAFGDGIVGALGAIAQRMQKRFPRTADDKNELDNEISTDENAR
jgi:uncharacterized membrane protein